MFILIECDDYVASLKLFSDEVWFQFPRTVVCNLDFFVSIIFLFKWHFMAIPEHKTDGSGCIVDIVEKAINPW